MGATRDRLWGPALVAAAATTVLTAGATERIELSVVWVSNPSGAPVTFTMSIGADGAGTRVIGGVSIPAGAVVPFGPFIVKEGEIVQLSAGTNNVLNASAHGIRRTAG